MEGDVQAASSWMERGLIMKKTGAGLSERRDEPSEPLQNIRDAVRDLRGSG